MKFITTFLIFASSLVCAQQSVVVNVEYQPQSQYKMNYLAKNSMPMKISGAKKFQKELKKSG